MDSQTDLARKWGRVASLLPLPATENNIDKLREYMLSYFSVAQKGSALILQGQEPPSKDGTFVADDIRVIPDPEVNLLSCAKIEIDWKQVKVQ